MALISQAVTLESRIPVLHFFDGFRTSHELNTLELLSDEQIASMIDADLVRAHRARALAPEHPFIRGTAHNPDTFFQARETVNPFYAAVPGIVQAQMDKFAALTGRHYHLFDFYGPPDAERVVLLMGTGAETARITAEALQARRRESRRVAGPAVPPVRRPPHFWRRCRTACARSRCWSRPRSRARRPNRCISMSSRRLAEALATGTRAACRAWWAGATGCRRRISPRRWPRRCSTNWRNREPKTRLYVGIDDDVSHTSLPPDPTFPTDPPDAGQRGVLRPWRGRHGRRQQEHRQDYRRGCRPACAGLFRLRFA